MLKRHHFFALFLAGTACSGRASAPPSPDRPQSQPPDLTGVRVMVLPAQPGPRAPGPGAPVPGLDEEIAFWLPESAPRVDWVMPEAIQRALARSPSIDVRLDALAVSTFHRAEVRNIGDPLFGDLRALNVLVDARYALIPVAAGVIRDSTGVGRVEMNIALIDTVGGRVLWFGAVAGEAGPAGAPEVNASAARALGQRFGR